MCDCHRVNGFRSYCTVWLLILLRVTVYHVATLKLLSPLFWHLEVGKDECKWWWNKFWLEFVLKNVENEMQTAFVMPDRSVYNTYLLLLSPSPLLLAEYLCSLSVFLSWEQRALWVCVERGCWEYVKGMQRKAPVCLILPLKEQLEGWGTSLLLLSLFFPVSFQKKTGCWMLTYHNVGQSTKKRGGGWREEGCVSTARQQKLIEQKKTLERRVHGSG